MCGIRGETNLITMHQFKELIVWKKSIELATEIYQLTKKFPPEERFGLISQMRRSVVSIASNIAEGSGRNGSNEFYHFLGISSGSVCELETQLTISKELKFSTIEETENCTKKLNSIKNMLHKLKSSLKITIK